MEAWTDCVGFEWDDGNKDKNWEKHSVADFECEEVFFNYHAIIVRHDPKHSRLEPRYYSLGCTDRDRPLFVAFTIRRRLIRVISARDMTAREWKIYETQKE
jgi:uncharacterized protein